MTFEPLKIEIDNVKMIVPPRGVLLSLFTDWVKTISDDDHNVLGLHQAVKRERNWPRVGGGYESGCNCAECRKLQPFMERHYALYSPGCDCEACKLFTYYAEQANVNREPWFRDLKYAKPAFLKPEKRIAKRKRA